MKIVAVDHQQREVRVSLRCPDFGEEEKEMFSEMGRSGQHLMLKGVDGTGVPDPGDRRSHDLRDLLYAHSLQELELKSKGNRLRGVLDSGAHVYFWARIPAQ